MTAQDGSTSTIIYDRQNVDLIKRAREPRLAIQPLGLRRFRSSNNSHPER